MDISSPKSANFGKHLSFEEVGQMFGNPSALHSVLNWIESESEGKHFKVEQTPNGEFVILTAPTSELEELLSAKFYSFTSPLASHTIRRAHSITLPEQVSANVDFVHNTVNFPAPAAKIIAYESAAQSGSVSPSTIRTVYNVPATPVTNKDATQSVFEALGQDFSPSDLSTFQSQFNVKQTPIAHVIGPNDPTQCTSNPNNCGEANLDVQYILAIAQNAETTYWSINPNAQDPFLDWVVALAKTAKPPLVHSISYGSLAKEDQVSDVFRFSLEICKLGLRGVTVISSSGDDGVANFQARNDPSQCGFDPSFPATCPYVTAVGATQGPESGQKEIACSSNTGGVVTTGGGFSYFFSRPDYQKAAVARYFATAPNLPPVGQYNNTARGYPDVAVLGYNYNVVIGGQTLQESGTSASAPVFAAMITLINNDRLNAKKKPLGFLNPSLYSLGEKAFNDITVGENNCCAGFPPNIVCCQYGFNATTGWDPLTGLGSPKFPALRAALVALP